MRNRNTFGISSWAILGLLVMALGIIEYVNFVSSNVGLQAFVGEQEWTKWLAAAIVAADIAAIGHNFLIANDQKTIGDGVRAIARDPIAQMLLLVWFTFATPDAYMNWVFLASQMQVDVPSAVAAHVKYFPIIGAVLIAGSQYALLNASGLVFGSLWRSARRTEQKPVQRKREGRDKTNGRDWSPKWGEEISRADARRLDYLAKTEKGSTM